MKAHGHKNKTIGVNASLCFVAFSSVSQKHDLAGLTSEIAFSPTTLTSSVFMLVRLGESLSASLFF